MLLTVGEVDLWVGEISIACPQIEPPIVIARRAGANLHQAAGIDLLTRVRAVLLERLEERLHVEFAAFHPGPGAAPEVWGLEAAAPRPAGTALYAEDMLEAGPRGVSTGRTLTESDVVAFATEVGELNPAYLNAEFAKRSADGARIVPPMLTFCIGFADFLRALLALPMSASGVAGHVGDRWRRFAPVHLGDTLQTRFKPLSVRASASRPERCVVHFGLQLVNQHDRVVQEGETVMLMPAGPGA